MSRTNTQNYFHNTVDVCTYALFMTDVGGVIVFGLAPPLSNDNLNGKSISFRYISAAIASSDSMNT